jgi:hypothetical protein
MRPLSSDLREFIRLLNTNSVKYVIVGAWARHQSDVSKQSLEWKREVVNSRITEVVNLTVCCE